uniref:SCP domain-containing protein n=1 Tax=Ditylenchus dipsaci TaxID=166011 RepID=A0A915EAS1_9BILA
MYTRKSIKLATSEKIQLGNEQISEILDFHNELKREVGNGLNKNKHANIFAYNKLFLGVKYEGDTASNNYRYEWHPKLAIKATQILSECSTKWDCKGKVADCTVALRERIKEGTMGYNMHAFKPNYRSRKIRSGSQKTKFNEIAELAQMLHSPASYIGCAIYKCDSGKTRTLFLCVYDQQIKSLTKPSQLFESGKACESDKECTTHNNSACDFATGMCVRLPTATGVLVETSIKFFHYMALLFNSFRSRVSMGIAKDSNGSMLPSAANMYKLMHSIDHTTNYSLRIGSWCLPHTYVTQKNTHQYFYRLNHDDPLYHELTTGVAEQRRYDKLVLKAFKQWEKEMLSTQLSFTKSADPHTHQVPEIAQMIVGSHTNLGCSIHDCKPNNYILLVCVLEHKHAFFKHPHNYLPYQSGRPCMLDSDCTYFADSRCDVSSVCVKMEP